MVDLDTEDGAFYLHPASERIRCWSDLSSRTVERRLAESEARSLRNLLS
jgi:hypothetical protein